MPQPTVDTARPAEGEFLYGATLRGQTVVKMKLDGTIVMTIGSAAIPDEFKVRNARSNELHYFDHPAFGVLVRVTPLPAQDASGRRPAA